MLLASVWIPIVGPFLGLFTPLPFLYYSAKLGVSQAVKLTGVSKGISRSLTSGRSTGGGALSSWSGGLLLPVFLYFSPFLL
jgi:hypothetical protein